MRYQKVTNETLRMRPSLNWDQKKEGPEGELRPEALAACGLGGRGIGRYRLVMNAGIAACRAEGYGGALLSALTISKIQFTVIFNRTLERAEDMVNTAPPATSLTPRDGSPISVYEQGRSERRTSLKRPPTLKDH